MYSFVRLLRTVYKYTIDGQLDPISVLNALLSKRPYLQLTRLLLNRSLQSPTDANLVQDVIRNNYQNEHGWSLIHFAAYEKNFSLMRTCIENDANLMITDNNGNTALHIAIQVAQKSKSRPGQRCGEDAWRTQPDKDDQKEYLKIVELILSSGDNGCFNELRTPEDHQPGQSNESRQCEQKSNQQTDRTNREFSQQQLVDRQTSPVAGEQAPTPPDSSVGQHGGPFAEQRNNYLTPNEPSEAQSNLVNKQNLFGKTSLHYACLLKPDRFSIKLIKRLLQSKANADIADFRNCTPLFYLLAEHQTEHRSRNESARKCSKACPLRSPFIDLLTNDLHIGYKCDRLNLDELDYGLATLKQLCRQAIQMHSPRLQRRQSIHYKALPDSLRLFLSRKVLPL